MNEMQVLSRFFRAHPSLRTRGFLPPRDPVRRFRVGSKYEVLDQIGAAIPSELKKDSFRKWAEGLEIPLMGPILHTSDIKYLRLYYVRTHFLQSAYVNQIGQPPVQRIPRNIAVPSVHAATLLNRQPILSYDGYALYNWYRIDPHGPIALGNLESIQNFVDLQSVGGVNQESWFFLLHVDIEGKFAPALAALELFANGKTDLDSMLDTMAKTVHVLTSVLRRIPEHMHSDDYFSKFRPYIMGFFNGVVYEGVSDEPKALRGETGAQSSIMPLLETLLKIPHKATVLTAILADMRTYMPHEHRRLLEIVDRLPFYRDSASRSQWNRLLEEIAEFRTVHLEWAKEYIDRHGDRRGTGGSQYIEWLSQLRDETLAYRKS